MRPLRAPLHHDAVYCPKLAGRHLDRPQHVALPASHHMRTGSELWQGEVAVSLHSECQAIPVAHHCPDTQTAIRTELGAIFALMEFSRPVWLITSLSPRSGEKMSKHLVRSGDIAGLLSRFTQLKEKARMRTGKVFPALVFQEAGLAGCLIHGVLHDGRIENYVVDPASIALSRRPLWINTDKIGGEALLRTLMAYRRGEPRVCAVVRARLRTMKIAAGSGGSGGP